jgi:putative transposase
MNLSTIPYRHRFPASIISQAIWAYHRFNNSYRDIEEQMAYRGLQVSYETIRSWSIKFADYFKEVIKKRERNPADKWHLDEMTVNGEMFIL